MLGLILSLTWFVAAAAAIRTACDQTGTTASTDQNNLNSQSYTLLNRPAMIARLSARCRIVFEGKDLCGLRVGRLPGSCARLRRERVGREGGWMALKL